MRRHLLLTMAVAVAVLVAAAVALAATHGVPLKLKAATAALKFDKKTLTAKAGSVKIVMSNPSVIPHNVALKGKGVNVKGKIVTKGGVSTVAAKLAVGTYTFYCSVPAHEAAGMKGTLKVS